MIADFNPKTGQLDIYNGNQAPHAHRTVYAHVAGLAEHMIRIRCNDIGGGFGNKVPVYPGLRVRDRRLDRRRRPGQVDRGPLGEPDVDRVRARLRDEGARCAPRTARSPGLRVDVIADHGAFDSTAQPTKFPAGFFHIVCGSYDLQAAHVKVKAVYTNKAPGRRRVPLLVPDHRGRVPRRADGPCARARDGRRPGRAADAELHRRPSSSRTRRRPAGRMTRATTRRR